MPVPPTDHRRRHRPHRILRTSYGSWHWHHQMKHSALWRTSTDVRPRLQGQWTFNVEGRLSMHQAADPYCRTAAQSGGTTSAKYKMTKNGLFVHVARIKSPVQILLPRTLPERILYHSHHSEMMSHLCHRQMYDTMERGFFWPYMASNMYTSVSNWSMSSQDGTSPKFKHELQLFSASGLLEFVPIDIL